MTKFGRRLSDLIKWRQYFNAWQGDGNRQTLGRTGCVVLMTWSCRKWRKITHVLRRKNSWTYLKTCKNGKNTTGRITGISAIETKHPKFAEKQVNGNGNLTFIELRMFQLVFKLWIQVSELCRKTTPNKQVTWRKTVWNGHELSPAGYTEKASTEPKFTYWVKWFHSAFMPIFLRFGKYIEFLKQSLFIVHNMQNRIWFMQSQTGSNWPSGPSTRCCGLSSIFCSDRSLLLFPS